MDRPALEVADIFRDHGRASRASSKATRRLTTTPSTTSSVPASSKTASNVRGTAATHLPRVPSLKAFGRRPQRLSHHPDGPSSETLNMSGPPTLWFPCNLDSRYAAPKAKQEIEDATAGVHERARGCNCGVAAARVGTTAYEAGDRISPSAPAFHAEGGTS
jgi:hypothetical protein